MNKHSFVTELDRRWRSDRRWEGITRTYTPEDVYRLRGTLAIQHTLASHGAARLWRLMREDPYVAVLSALTGNQAVQQARAGLKAIYISGWQVAADANCAMTMYPDQSLYPSDSVPMLVSRIQNALRRADEIHHMNGDHAVDWYVPLVADAEAGFGGVLNAYELMKLMIAAGAAGVHFEDQLASEKKCGHLGGKVELAALQLLFLQDLCDHRFHEITRHRPSVRELGAVTDPLPHLRARDLRGRRVFHEVVDRHAADAAQPRLEILNPDVDIRAQSGVGDFAVGYGEQIARRDAHVVAPHRKLVGSGQ